MAIRSQIRSWWNELYHRGVGLAKEVLLRACVLADGCAVPMSEGESIVCEGEQPRIEEQGYCSSSRFAMACASSGGGVNVTFSSTASISLTSLTPRFLK